MIHRTNRRLPLRCLGGFFALLLGVAAIFESCKAPNDLGSLYFKDTIQSQTSIRYDTGFMQFSDTVKRYVTAGVNYAIDDSTNLMIIGRVVNDGFIHNGENLQSWGILQFLPISSDTVGTTPDNSLIQSAELILKDENFSYGDTMSSQVGVIAYSEYLSGFSNWFDSIGAFLPLPSPASDSVNELFTDSTDRQLVIPLNQNAIQNLNASNNVFVITPDSSMVNARGFGTVHNWPNDANSFPELVLHLKGQPSTDSVIYYPLTDYHVVSDMSQATPQNEFTTRGGVAQREKIHLTLNRPTDTAQLNSYTTINDATLTLYIDTAYTRRSDLGSDVAGPDISLIGVSSTGIVDSACHYDGNGTLDTINWLCTFQLRGAVEEWLRDSIPNAGFYIQSGFVSRSFNAGGSQSIGVEDNTLNRWTFYGPSPMTPPSKRPFLTLSYSRLK